MIGLSEPARVSQSTEEADKDTGRDVNDIVDTVPEQHEVPVLIRLPMEANTDDAGAEH